MSYKQIMEQIHALDEKRRDILAKAKSENRVWNSDEMTEYANIEKEQVKLRSDAETALAFETAVTELDSAANQPQNRSNNPAAANARSGGISEEMRSEAFRDWLIAADPEVCGNMSAERRARARQCGFSVESNKITLRRLPRNVEHRAPQTITTTGGGYTIPDEMMRAIDVAMRDYGGLYNYATIIRTATGAPLPIPTINDTSTGAGYGAKLDINTQVSEQAMTFGQLVLDAYKYTSKLVLVPFELLQDTILNPGEFIGGLLGERIARCVSYETVRGDGTGDINGIATAAASASVALAADNAPTYANLLSIQHAVDPAYRNRPSCAWMFSDTVFQNIKAIVDGSSRPLWLPNIIAGSPETLLGHPIIVNTEVDNAGTIGARSVIFGDMSKYIIREVADIEVLRLNERYADYAQVGFVAFARYDGDLLNAGTNPVVYATNP